jgi:hypothetical protein
MSAPVRMFGYLRPHSSLKPHEVPTAEDAPLADALIWTVCDWRDDPDWLCVAIGEVSLQRLPAETYVPRQVEALRKVQQGVRAAAEMKAREIEAQISSLLAITHEVPSTVGRVVFEDEPGFAS